MKAKFGGTSTHDDNGTSMLLMRMDTYIHVTLVTVKVVETKNVKAPNTTASGVSSKARFAASNDGSYKVSHKLSFEWYYKSTFSNT